MNNFELIQEIKNSAKEQNITFKELMSELKKFKKELKMLKSREGLIEKVELNLEQYPKKGNPSPDNYLCISSNIINNLLTLEMQEVVSFKIKFKDGTYISDFYNGRQYSNSYNSFVYNTIYKLLNYVTDLKV